MAGPSFVVPPQGEAAKMMLFDAQKKSMGVSYVLWFFLGGLGAHRFYLGQTGSAVGMLVLFFISLLLTIVVIGWLGLIALWIWLIVDAFLIPGMVREHNTQLAHALSYQQPNAAPPAPAYAPAPAFAPATAPYQPPPPYQSPPTAGGAKLCPSCNGANNSAGRFCNHCGTALVPQAT